MSESELICLEIGKAVLGSYGGFFSNNIPHQSFYDDEIFISGSKQIILLPPARWVVSSNRLDKIEVNYKSPESLNLQKGLLPEQEHKKAIWKLAVLIYTALYGVVPWSYSEATGNVHFNLERLTT